MGGGPQSGGGGAGGESGGLTVTNKSFDMDAELQLSEPEAPDADAAVSVRNADMTLRVRWLM